MRKAMGLLGMTLAWALASGLPCAAQDQYGARAREIMDATGVKGGLVVHVGCGDGRLTAALCVNGSYLVHGVDADAGNVEQAREHIRSLGLYGKVSVEQWVGSSLPYGDGVVNLLVSERLGRVRMADVLRVLAPEGVAYIENGRRWNRTVKPRPKEMDEWTHWLHGPDGNAVAEDTVVGPPRHVQWVAGPLWQRHHNTVPSVTAMVSSNGRLFYISDEAPAGISGLPDQWFLMARDAFNGVLLWKRPIDEWGWREWSDREISRFNQPTHIARRLVAAGDRVYVTLGFNAPLTALDAATGETVRTYPGTEFTSEILHQDGLLVLAVNESAQKPGRSAEQSPEKKRVVAIQAETGQPLWQKGGFVGVSSKADALERITHLLMAIGDGRVYFVEDDAVVSLDLANGAELWRAPRPEWDRFATHFGYYFANLCTLVYHDGVVLLSQPQFAEKSQPWNAPVETVLVAIAAETGEQLWTYECGTWGHYNPGDVFVIGGLVYAHGLDTFTLVGLDPLTGDVRRTLSTDRALNKAHHHRCYRNKATERYVLTSRRGVEFIDIESGDNHLHHWVRGVCRFGILPCNGLLYAPPHPCICYVTAKLNGMWAVAPERQPAGRQSRGKAEARLERGPAYQRGAGKHAGAAAGDWPTYRHDALRSGAASSAAPADLERLWQADVGGSASSVTVGEGKAFVTSGDAHRVCALDADDGTLVWSYTTGAGVDSPPTIHEGMALFGCADGWVYCLRASDGKLVWRFRAAPEERRIVAFGRLESAWPVHGSVLVKDGIVYAAAGRSSFLDGGIYVYALDPGTGTLLQERRIDSRDPETGDMPDCRLPYDMLPDALGALPDVLASDGSFIYMRQTKLDPADISRPLRSTWAETTPEARRGEPQAGPQVMSTAGFLDGSWFNQTYWTYEGVAHCKLLVCDEASTYGVKPFPGSRRHSRAIFRPGEKGYKLFAYDRATKKERWAVQAPVRVEAMVLAADTLFAAGAPDVVDPEDPWGAFEGRKGAVLVAFSASDGSKLVEHELDAPPVFDGMAAANGRLYITTKDGRVVCMGGK
ncbi:MAG: PQQ-binding-like beta-propeller repeat protein [Armatimonadota bacterium]